jgi:hypothetical protein
MAAVIRELIAEGKSRAQVIRAAALALGVDESEAAVIYAIETGESEGDVIAVDRDGTQTSGYPAGGDSILRGRV